MDQVIDLSGADKGFLLFKSEETLRIQSARNVNQETLDATMGELSRQYHQDGSANEATTYCQ